MFKTVPFATECCDFLPPKMTDLSLTLADRKRLAAILGMLGSEHPSERNAAVFEAVAVRHKHQLTWAELLALPPVEVASELPAPSPTEPEPEPSPAPTSAASAARCDNVSSRAAS